MPNRTTATTNMNTVTGRLMADLIMAASSGRGRWDWALWFLRVAGHGHHDSSPHLNSGEDLGSLHQPVAADLAGIGFEAAEPPPPRVGTGPFIERRGEFPQASLYPLGLEGVLNGGNGEQSKPSLLTREPTLKGRTSH